MSYQVLARKWRPKNFSEVRGQEHITRTLVNSIKQDKIAHAYLLTGTRGIGKTTIARIFAKAIRCESLSPEGNPCLECHACKEIDNGNSLDYLEIDGASNNSVDDIRDLIETVQYLPSSGRYKVYVVDEVHMLTISAFNALLKTLEEPPKHVVFIFATTDPQKLLGTVLSRCQRFDFKNSTIDETTKLIKDIAEKENIKFENDKIPLELAKQGDGSFRDSLSLFDQVLSLSSDNTITEETLILSLGIAKTSSIKSMVEALFSKNKEEATNIFYSVIGENVDIKSFSLQILDKIYFLIQSANLAGELRDSDLSEEVLNCVSLIETVWIYENMAKDLEWSLKSVDPVQMTAIVFMKICLREQVIQRTSPALHLKKKDLIKENIPEQNPNIEENSNIQTIEVENRPSQEEELSVEKPEFEKEKLEESREVEAPTVIVEGERTWEGFLKFLYVDNKSLAMNLERGNLASEFNPDLENIILTIAFSQECKIFYDYICERENKDKIIKLVKDYLGKEIDINVNTSLIDDETKESTNFKSVVEIEEDAEAKRKAEQRERIINNKFIKSAEELFDTKIEKIILNDDN